MEIENKNGYTVKIPPVEAGRWRDIRTDLTKEEALLGFTPWEYPPLLG